jgi:hypothetical protein
LKASAHSVALDARPGISKSACTGFRRSAGHPSEATGKGDGTDPAVTIVSAGRVVGVAERVRAPVHSVATTAAAISGRAHRFTSKA